MSTREIIAELPHLTVDELNAIGQRIAELTSRQTTDTASKSGVGLRAERIAGRLVLSGPRVVRQVELEAILDEFP